MDLFQKVFLLGAVIKLYSQSFGHELEKVSWVLDFSAILNH
jgi:hypothetical protein